MMHPELQYCTQLESFWTNFSIFRFFGVFLLFSRYFATTLGGNPNVSSTACTITPIAPSALLASGVSQAKPTPPLMLGWVDRSTSYCGGGVSGCFTREVRLGNIQSSLPSHVTGLTLLSTITRKLLVVPPVKLIVRTSWWIWTTSLLIVRILFQLRIVVTSVFDIGA